MGHKAGEQRFHGILCTQSASHLTPPHAIFLACRCHTDLEWKLIYVGSAEDENYYQQFESVLVGPVNVGTYHFVLEVVERCRLGSGVVRSTTVQ